MPITLTDDAGLVTTGNAVVLNLLANDTIDPASVTFSVNGVTGGVLQQIVYGSFGELTIDQTGVVRYRPYTFMSEDHQLNLGGTLTDTFTYMVSGDGQSDTATLTIDITSGYGLRPYDSTADSAIAGGTRTTYSQEYDSFPYITAHRDVRGADTDIYTFYRVDGYYDLGYSNWVQEVDDNGQIVSNVKTLNSGITITYTYDYAGSEDFHTRAVWENGGVHVQTFEDLDNGNIRIITDHTGGGVQDHQRTLVETVPGDRLLERRDYADGTYFEERWDAFGARIYEAQGYLPADSIIAERIDEFQFGSYLTDRAITFHDGDTLTYRFDPGGSGSVTGIRNLGEANQYSYSAFLNADGTLRTETLDFDNGREVVRNFSNGVISTLGVTDPGAADDYATLAVDYDTDGRITFWNADMDNGDIVRKQFVEGVRILHYREDGSDSANWFRHVERYQTGTGDLVSREITFDNGVSMTLRLSPDGRTVRRVDVEDAFDWDFRELNHNAAGDMILRSVVNDDGSGQSVGFHDNGVVSTRSVSHAPGEHDFRTRTTYFDESGDRSGVDFIFEDMSMRGVRFDSEGRVDERRSSSFEDGTIFARSVFYDDFGNRTSRVEREMTGLEGVIKTWTYDTDGNVLDYVVEDIVFPMF